MGLITQTSREYYEGHQLFTGDGSTTEFTLTFSTLPTAESEFRVFIDGDETDDDNHSYNSSTGVAEGGTTTLHADDGGGTYTGHYVQIEFANSVAIEDVKITPRNLGGGGAGTVTWDTGKVKLYGIS